MTKFISLLADRSTSCSCFVILSAMQVDRTNPVNRIITVVQQLQSCGAILRQALYFLAVQ